MRKFTARNNFRKLFIMAIIFASLLSVIPIMGFVKHSSKNKEFVVEYVKGYGDNLIQKYNKGEKLNLPTPPTRKGFDFVGWFLKEDNKLIVNEEIFINKELTIYAKWEKKQYVLHYENSSLILNFESLFVKERDRLKIVSGEHVDDIFYPNKDGFTFNKFIIKNEENIFDVDTFSFDEIEGEDIYLIPVFDENFVNFEMAESCLFKVENLSHQNKVSVFDKLYFEITLDESVSQSNINITASSGEVYMAEMGGKYFVEIKNFNQNFSINIENVELNKYSIVFNNEGEFLEQNFVHGQNLVVPQIEKGGYKLIGFKDEKGRYYYSDYIVHCDLMLFAVWEEELYKVLFPRTNGMFVINFEGEKLTSSKEVVKKYQESLNFSIKLSNAYNNSNVIVYGKTKLRNINFRLEDGVCC